MAYGLLANVPPVLGIYTSIFPVLVYSILGPSAHVSKGIEHKLSFIRSILNYIKITPVSNYDI